MKKAAVYIILLLIMATTILPSYLYNSDDDNIELTEKEKSEKETEIDYKLKFVPFTYTNIAHTAFIYSNLQATQFALFAHFPDDENHSSSIDFPPEIA